MSRRTLHRRLRQVAGWRRPKLIARGDPHREAILAATRRRTALLPNGAKICTVDETHVASAAACPGPLDAARPPPRDPHPGKNRQITVLGALEVATGAFFCQLGRRCAADFLTLLQQLLAAYPNAPAIAIICDNDQIHPAHTVRDFIADHPRVHLWFSARYSPHDNPTERIWAALKTFTADTPVSWPGRQRQIHAFFRSRSPDQNLAATALWTSPWFLRQLPTDLLEAA
jgi:transposase